MLTKDERRAAVKAAADRVMPGISAVLQSDAAIAKAKKYHEDRAREHMDAAEREAANSNFQAAVYRLTDALNEALSLIAELRKDANG